MAYKSKEEAEQAQKEAMELARDWLAKQKEKQEPLFELLKQGVPMQRAIEETKTSPIDILRWVAFPRALHYDPRNTDPTKCNRFVFNALSFVNAEKRIFHELNKLKTAHLLINPSEMRNPALPIFLFKSTGGYSDQLTVETATDETVEQMIRILMALGIRDLRKLPAQYAHLNKHLSVKAKKVKKENVRGAITSASIGKETK